MRPAGFLSDQVAEKVTTLQWAQAQMKRMDPSSSERSLGFRSFSDFLRSRSDLVDLDESSTTRMVRLHSDT